MELTKKDMIELGLTARINDKLQRIKSAGLKGFDEDNLKDLIGYLILFRIAQSLKE
jgi:BRCT domain type II-containing protein